MKYRLLIVFLLMSSLTTAVSLPENIYFRAMRDEMARSKKDLRLPGEVKPFYIAYRVDVTQKQVFSARLGALVSEISEQEKQNTPSVRTAVYLYAGDSKHNSSGLDEPARLLHNQAIGRSSSMNSYDSLRDNLWYLTDREYVNAVKRAERKAALKRDKQLRTQEPEFSYAPRAQFVDTIASFVPRERAHYNKWVKQLSAEGKKYSYLENFGVQLTFGQKEQYFLDSEGNFYQLQIPNNTVVFQATLRNHDGLLEEINDEYILPLEESLEKTFVEEKAARFLQYVQKMHKARKGDFYTGPVLLVQDGAAQFLERLLVENLRYTKPRLMESNMEDPTVGKLTKKINHRILSIGLDVVDRPSLRMFNGFPLTGFRPIDAEGVAAQELQVVENGKLKEIPTLRSLLPGQKSSNGHAYANYYYPRAILSNVFVTARQPLTEKQLEEKLLALCSEQELEYCYIIHSWQGRDGLNLAERIYTADGHREPIYGLMAEQENDTRALRDIVAAGDKLEIFGGEETAIIAPSLLINEIELKPIERNPDRPHFVPMP